MIKQALEYYNAKFGINQEGATAVEYGLLVALIAAVIILAVVALGDTLEGVFTDTEATITQNTP
jgi:pilus assembly protein Flp/PilA